ncbi:hypothetical protein BS47DRAFT_1402190 [Hydnum rufescens UP504]|uniref:Uncharacterized protein n=1 Tax=Hydnum rufescens UP504 TaxID=1448309 RepID=A0A9P6ADN5_9AGAM|nr:hypothetical protein BS47DRAFT_1402190 [Hydnum rufescens UP504]
MLFYSLAPTLDPAPNVIQNVHPLILPPVLHPQCTSLCDPGTPVPSESAMDASNNTIPLLFTDTPYPMAQIPVHEWYTLVVGPLPKGAEREHWLEEFTPYGCLGVQQTQQKKHHGFQTWSMCLAFKSRRHLGMVYNTLTSQAEIRGLSQFQIKDVFMEMVSYIWLFEPRYIEHAIAYHRSQSDLQEMVKRAPLITSAIRLPPTCQEILISHSFKCAWWQEHNSNPSSSFKHRFLDTLTFPPCLSGGNQSLLPPLAKERICPMDIVSFEKTWLFDKLASIAISDIPPYLHRLEMVMHSHLEPPPRSQVMEFSVYMWPTNGPYDKLIQLIAKWVIEDGGSCVNVEWSSTCRANETFGY